MSKLLIIDSEHRKTGSSPNKFTVSVSNSNLDAVKRVSLIMCRTINSQYNISEGVNNVIEYTYNGIPDTVVIQEGQYNVTEFMAYVNGYQNDFVLSLDPVNSRFVWTGGGAPLTIYQTDSMDETLGLTEDLVSIGPPVTSPLLPDLSGLSVIHVSSEALSHGNSVLTDGSTGNILSSIPINTPFGLPIVYLSDSRDSSDNHTFQIPQNLNGSIDIELLDHNYRPLKIKSEIHLVFKLSF